MEFGSKFDIVESVLSMVRDSLTDGETLSIKGHIKYGKKNKYQLFFPDGYCPKGCRELEIPSQCIIEVIIKLTANTILRYKQIFDSIIEGSKAFKEKEQKITNFFLIYRDSSGFLNLDKIQKRYKEEGFLIRHYDEIKNRARQNTVAEEEEEEEDGDEFKDRASQYPIGEKKKGKRKEWLESRQARIDEARAKFREGENTFFLGAGVSVSKGLPSWEQLLKSISNEYMKRSGIQNNEFYDELKTNCWDSLIVVARYIRVRFEEAINPANRQDLNEEFLNIVHNALYHNTEKTDTGLVKTIIEAISKGKVASVITYNFDDLIENELKKENYRNFSSISSSEERRHLGSFPIYHVHGTIHKEKDENYQPQYVFCEDDYHRIYKEAYHWSNVIQLYALSHTTCFFIGLSMSDPNLRRLLDISSKGDKQYRHFAFLKRDESSDVSDSNLDEETNDNHCQTIEKMMEQWGIRVIWYKDYTEVPNLIEELSKRTQSIFGKAKSIN